MAKGTFSVNQSPGAQTINVRGAAHVRPAKVASTGKGLRYKNVGVQPRVRLGGGTTHRKTAGYTTIR